MQTPISSDFYEQCDHSLQLADLIRLLIGADPDQTDFMSSFIMVNSLQTLILLLLGGMLSQVKVRKP